MGVGTSGTTEVLVHVAARGLTEKPCRVAGGTEPGGRDTEDQDTDAIKAKKLILRCSSTKLHLR